MTNDTLFNDSLTLAEPTALSLQRYEYIEIQSRQLLMSVFSGLASKIREIESKTPHISHQLKLYRQSNPKGSLILLYNSNVFLSLYVSQINAINNANTAQSPVRKPLSNYHFFHQATLTSRSPPITRGQNSVISKSWTAVD